jgi:cell division protein FtsX
MSFFQSTHSKFIISHTKQIIKDSLFQFIWISVLVGFLLYLLHILVGLSFGVQHMSQTIQDKLGVYFYIKDSPNQQDQTYSKVIEMKSRLEKLGMKVQYLSKDDAMKSIERKIPSVLDSFQKYGIKNPLPATVYVLFNNSKDYDKLRAVVTLYADIISNREDISKIGESIKKQEARVLHTLGLTHFIVFLSFFLVLVLVIIVCSFLMLVIKTKFDRFRKMLSIQQLLGTPYRLIKIPFMIVIWYITVLGFFLSLLLWWFTVAILGRYLDQLFESDLVTLLGKSTGAVLLIQWTELIAIILLVMVIGYAYMHHLLLQNE